MGSHTNLEFHGATITSGAGLVPYRQLDETPGLTARAGDMFRNPPPSKLTLRELTGWPRRFMCSCLAGYKDTNNAERFAADPAKRRVVGGRDQDRRTVLAGAAPWTS